MKIHPRKFPCHIPFSCRDVADAARVLFTEIKNKTQGLVDVSVVEEQSTLRQQIIDLHTGKTQMSMIASRGNIAGQLMDLAFVYRMYNDPRITQRQQTIFQSLYHKIYTGHGEFRTHSRGPIANINGNTVCDLAFYRSLLQPECYGKISSNTAIPPTTKKAVIGFQTVFIIPTNLVYLIGDDYCLISLLTGYQTWHNLRKPMQHIVNETALSLTSYPNIEISDVWI